jgi:diguanylate cyclase (GGDEF)-like protein/putative nucleotidyltransferase with HDIG domain
MSPNSSSPSQRSAKPGHLRLLAGQEGSASADQLIEQAQTAERQGRREEARALYERALYCIKKTGEASKASALLRWIARTYQGDADFDAAMDCAEAALAIAEASGDDAGVGHAINQQAAVRWQQGRLDDAEQLFVRARASALHAGEARLAAMTAQNLGVIANIRGDHEKALRHYEESLADYRALGMAKDVCNALNNLGMLYTDTELWELAERSYVEALQISTVLGDLGVRTIVEVNLAALRVAQGLFNDAKEACDRAMALSRQTQDAASHGEAYKIYGIISREKGEYSLSEQHFTRAEQIAKDRQDLLLSAEVARERAELHFVQGRNRDTLQCLNRAHRLFSQLRARHDLAEVDRRTGKLETNFLDIVRRWSESIESKDRYTRGHCERVADIACALASRAGIDQQSLFWFRIGALLHDVGKLIIPSEVLNKPGKLTPEEWELVKRHPSAGVEMLAEIEFPWDVLPLVESHHERWDGTGYPHRLFGEAIPREARILCIADVYDALTSQRSYKRSVTHIDALNIMRQDVGTQFDPELFSLFEDVMREGPPVVEPVLAPPRVSGATQAIRTTTSDRIDELTGIPLRRAFLDAAALTLEEYTSSGQPVSLLVIDVDRFKLVNDTYGHLQGDDVLRLVAKSLREQTRSHDLLGRYAGDEFVVLLPGASLQVASEVAERLREAVQREHCPLRTGEGEVGVTLSIGIATAPAHGESVEALFAAGDRALYQVKRRGRNAVALAALDGEEVEPPRLDLERFVGRNDELRRLVRLLEVSVVGQPKVVAIVGEAGVGKTTLVKQLEPEVRLRATSVVKGRCLEADVRPPYGPWADVIDAIRELGVVPDREWRELPQLVPALVGEGKARRTPGSKFALLDEIAEYLSLATAQRPLVVVLDDMQWADSASWDTLEHVLARLGGERLLICLTIRAEDSLGETVRRRTRLAHDGRYEELFVSRLTREELKQWMEGAFHREEMGREFLAFLYQHTEGNALFVVQVLRTLVDEGAIWHNGERWEWKPVSELRLPVAVGDLISRRLERLSAEARAVLTTAALLGRTFDTELAVEAGAGTPEQLLAAIEEGIAAAVIEAVHDGSGKRYTFTHALLVEVIRDSANPRRLRRMHERVARMLEERSPGAVAEIASHFESAGNAEKAYEYALLAGAAAARVHAHGEATRFFSMAERHAVGAEHIAEARLRLAQVAEAEGRYADAEELCDLVLAWFDGTSEHARRLAVARMRERLRALQGQQPQRTLEACRDLLAEAEAGRYEGECIALLTMISQAHSRLGDWPAAEALARDCVRRADAIGDKRLHADAVIRLGTTLLDARPAEAIALFDQALELFRGADDRYGEVRCHINIGIAHSRTGSEAAAEEVLRTAIDLGRSAHAPDLAGLASLNLGVLNMKGGRWRAARSSLDEALHLFTTVRNEPHRLSTLYNLAHLARESGDPEAALSLYEATATLARTLGQPDCEIGALAGAGLVALALDRRAVAERGERNASLLVQNKSDWWFQGRELLEALSVRMAILAGGVATAERQFVTALALAERHDVYGAAWLVAECAPGLAAAGFPAIWETVNRFAHRVEALGFASLSARYAALNASRTETALAG